MENRRQSAEEVFQIGRSLRRRPSMRLNDRMDNMPRDGTVGELVLGILGGWIFGILAVFCMCYSNRLRTSRRFTIGLMVGLMLRIVTMSQEMSSHANYNGTMH